MTAINTFLKHIINSFHSNIDINNKLILIEKKDIKVLKGFPL
jgi:hypothetical protein